jgi:hypothetical protein
METALIRMVWASVEACRNGNFVDLSDSVLVQHLLSQLNRDIRLNDRDHLVLKQYLNDRVMLIRDLLEV